MAYYFVGGEDHEFTKVGANSSVDTATTAQRRTANSRCSLKVAAAAAGVTDGWQSPAFWGGAQSLFWFSGRWGWSTGAWASASVNSSDLVAFIDGIRRRLILTCEPGASGLNGSHWRLAKRNAANTTTVLQTSSVFIPCQTASLSAGTPPKIDIFVSYGTSGQVMVFVDGTKVLDYSGDVTTDGASTLDSVAVGTLGNTPGNTLGVTSFWSEIIVRSTDTRSVNLNMLYPAANGNAWQWSNDYTKVNEVTTDDTGLASTASNDQVSEATVNSGSIVGNPGVQAVIVSARAAKGGSGPTQAQLMLRTGSVDYVSATLALPAALGPVSAIWETNPSGAGALLYSDLTDAGFNVGIKSKA